MRAKTDSSWQTEPTNVGVAVLAPVAELGLVHLCVAGDALRARARRVGVAFVVTGLALRLGMTPGQAQTGMIAPGVRDLAPVGFVVARGAFGVGEPAFVGILVAGHAVGLQTEKRRMTAPVLAIMAIIAFHRRVSALERPTRLAMVEALARATWPPNQLGVSSEMLDVALATVLPSILATVQACLLPYPSAQVIVAAETGVGIEPLTGRMALVAFRISLEVRVGVGQLARRQELGAG